MPRSARGQGTRSTAEESDIAVALPATVPGQPVAVARPEEATLHFWTGWSTSLRGHIRPGGRLTIDYELDRLPICRGHREGAPAWSIIGHVMFHPGGQLYNGTLVQHFVGDPLRVVNPPRMIPFGVPVPTDAAQVEMWFQNTDASGCTTWDSSYGQNYWLDVVAEGLTIPKRSVSYRTGAIPSLEMVNVLTNQAVKKDVFPKSHGGGGTDLQTWLSVRAWVRNIDYIKYAWVDVHIFDSMDELLESKTVALDYSATAAGGGACFALEGKVYQGGTAVPGGVSLRPDARKVQYRLYYEVQRTVFTDGLLHQLEVSADEDMLNPHT
jgi:hypothetical protein